jgi:hypothetical protein
MSVFLHYVFSVSVTSYFVLRIDKHYLQPAKIGCWAIVLYEVQSRFSEKFSSEMEKSIVDGCRTFGENIFIHLA